MFRATILTVFALICITKVQAATATSKPASTSDDWGGALNLNSSTYAGAWLAAVDSTVGGAGQVSYYGWDGSSRFYAKSTRFPSLSIPQGATIDSAEWWVKVGCSACTDSVMLIASILDADDGFQVVDTDDFRLKFASKATGSGDIDTAYIPVGTAQSIGAYYRVPFNKLDMVIQNNISRAGWASGNSVTLFLTSVGGSAGAAAKKGTREYSYSSGTTYDSLWVSYTVGGGGGGGTPNTIVRSATVRSVILRAPEKMFYRRETWKW